MDFISYYAIAERNLDVQNPITPAKLGRLADLCRLHDGARVLDIGCGKGWLLRSWAEACAVHGTGLEINPHFVADAREQTARRGLGGRLRFIEGPASGFTPERGVHDILLCIGATFALGGFEPALAWMSRALVPGGTIAVGDVFAVRPFPPEADEPEPPDLSGRMEQVRAAGFETVATIEATRDDWDAYEGAKWAAVLAWAEANPADRQHDAALQRMTAARSRYLAWQRDHYGWAILVLRRAF